MSTFAKIDFTFRVIVLILAMTIGVMFVFVGARNALAANLKPAAIVTGNVFTVGDIFSGLSQEMSQKVLGPAPQPGQDMTLNARTLMRVAVALELPWRPSSNADQITVTRAATLIDTAQIEDTVRSGLQDKGVDGAFEISFLNGGTPQLVIPRDLPATADLAEINFDPRTDRFTATVVAPSRDKPHSEIMISGRIDRLVDIPVLKRTTSNGDVIDAYSVEWTTMKASEIQHDMVLDEENLIGMTPRRMIVSGKPVRENELERPVLVSRGDTITITYNDGFMALTTQGKAMQSGARGDLIRVVNTGSNRTIEAFVEGEFLVTVSQ